MHKKIPTEGNPPVFIAKSKAIVFAQGFSSPVVAVIPDTRNWNDFGRGYFAHLYVVEGNSELFSAHIRVMFDGYIRSETALSDLIKNFGQIFPIENIETQFVSLLPEETMYGELISILGFDYGVSALRKLHDAVVLRLEGDKKELVALTYSEEFSIGVLRYGGAYSALRRGARHFTPRPRAAVEDSAQKFEFLTQLPNSKNEVVVGFDFTAKAVFRDRIAVLVGQNGTGKTRFLKSMVDGLIKSTDEVDLETIPRFFPPIDVHRVLVFSSVPTDPFPRRIGAWEGIDYDYFPVNPSRSDRFQTLVEALVALRFEDGEVSLKNGESTTRLSILLEVLTKLGLERLCLPLRKREENDNLPGVIEFAGNSFLPITKKFNEQNTLTAYQQIAWEGTPAVMDRDKVPRDLSSGEVAMLHFSAQLIAAIENGSLLLLDEPETHLHPKYISDLVEVLYTLLDATKSIAVIATHSAYIVREASRDNVKILSLKDGILFFDSPRMQTLGASIDTISQFAFGDTNESHHFQKILANWVRSIEPSVSLDQIIKGFGEHLNSESLSFIARSLNKPSEED